MASFMLIVAVTTFLSGGAAAIFLMIVIGIHKADNPRRRRVAQGDPMDAFTRSVLGTGTWPSGPTSGDDESD